MSLRRRQSLILTVTFAAVLCGVAGLARTTEVQAQTQAPEPVQPWGLQG